MDTYIWKQVFKADGEPVLSVTLRRPELSSPKRPIRHIGRYYEKLADTWKDHWERVLLPKATAALRKAREESRPFQAWSAALDFVVTRETEAQLSLYHDATELGPARYPLIVRSADTWDLNTGFPISLSAFLPQALQKRKALLAELKRQVATQLAGGESLFFEDVEHRVESAFSPHRFYLTEHGPVLFYPMLSLGSPVERTPIFPL